MLEQQPQHATSEAVVAPEPPRCAHCKRETGLDILEQRNDGSWYCRDAPNCRGQLIQEFLPFEIEGDEL